MGAVTTRSPGILAISTMSPSIDFSTHSPQFPHPQLRSNLLTWAGQPARWPPMKPGVYVNFMSGDEQDRVPEAYQQRWERMVTVKTHYDPGNFFRLNQNVQPRKN